jgi:hypothetical protein
MNSNNNSDISAINTLNLMDNLRLSSLDASSQQIYKSIDLDYASNCMINDINNDPKNSFWNGVSNQMELNNIMLNVGITKGADIPNVVMGSFLSSANEQLRTRSGEEKTLRSAVGIISGGLCASNLVIPNRISAGGCIVGGALLGSEIIEARIHAQKCKDKNGNFSDEKYNDLIESNKKNNEYTSSYALHPLQTISGYSSGMSKKDTMQALLNQKMHK